MSDRPVLVDSSVWIGYLLGQQTARTRAIPSLLRAHRAAVNAVIQAELLTGAADDAQYAALDDTLGGLHLLELTHAVWRRAARVRFELRRAGALVPLPDVVIACCALAYDCPLLQMDRHFDRIAAHTRLRFCRDEA